MTRIGAPRAALLIGSLLVGSVVVAQGHPTHFTTHLDRVPNFAINPTITTQGGCASTCAWSDPSSWTGSRVPSTGDIVLIETGHVVEYDGVRDQKLDALGIAGELRFRTDRDTRLVVGTLQVFPDGRLQVGTKSDPVDADVTAEIVIVDSGRSMSQDEDDPLTGIYDPEQFGTSVLVFGEIEVHGAVKQPTWVRLAEEPRAGQSSIRLASSVSGWRPGDQVVIPDTRHLSADHEKAVEDWTNAESQTELARIQSISGNQITLDRALVHDHPGPRESDGSITRGFNGEQLLPHVGNLTRNVIFRSEDPFGTRAHGMFLGRASVSVYYSGWYDMGRTTTDDLDSTELDGSGNVSHMGTNQAARYVFHFHHAHGPARPSMPRGMSKSGIRDWLDSNGWQHDVVGNAFSASSPYDHLRKWGVTLHGTHFTKVTDNVVYNIAGAGIQTEEGGESYNLVARNFTVRIPGEGHVRVPRSGEETDVSSNLGRDGSGLWFRGAHVWVEDNVAADCEFSGVYYSGYYLEDVTQPLFPGANPMDSNEVITIDAEDRAILSNRGNETYGPMQIGLWGAWPAGCCDPKDWPLNLVEDFVAWHPWKAAVQWYHSGATMFDNIILRGDAEVLRSLTTVPGRTGREVLSDGMDFTSYELLSLTVQNADIRGYRIGINMPRKTEDEDSPDASSDDDPRLEPPATVRDSYLENFVNVRIMRPHKTAKRKRSVVDNVRFGLLSGEHPLKDGGVMDKYNIELAGGDDPNSSTREWYRVYSYDGVVGDDFGLYRDTSTCSDTRPLIDGYVCPLEGDPPPPPNPPPTPTGLRIR